jgi:hypothetical protein
MNVGICKDISQFLTVGKALSNDKILTVYQVTSNSVDNINITRQLLDKPHYMPAITWELLDGIQAKCRGKDISIGLASSDIVINNVPISISKAKSSTRWEPIENIVHYKVQYNDGSLAMQEFKYCSINEVLEFITKNPDVARVSVS